MAFPVSQPTKAQWPIWFFLVGLYFLLFFHLLFQQGMFMDGILYATVSRNFAQSHGAWFDFIYNAKPFYDQPPLALWLQSVLFTLFGDSIYVERIYSFFCGLIAVCFLILIWRRVHSNNELANFLWVPIFFFCSVPLIFWSYSNNMLENTLSVFVLASVYFQLLCIANNYSLFFLCLSSCSVFLAFLSKGLVGLFPLVFFLFHWLIFRSVKISKMIAMSFLLLVITGICCYTFFSLVPGSREYFQTQFSAQVINSLSGNVNLSLRPFLVPRRLFQELLPAIIFGLIFWVIAYRRGYYSWLSHKQTLSQAILFLLLGLSASLPIMMSYKQRGYYLVPSLHFFVLSVSIFMGPILKSIFDRVEISDVISKWVKSSIVIFLAVSLIFSFSTIGKIGRNQDKIADVVALGNIIGRGQKITIAKNLAEDWYLLGYFQRFFDISLEPYDGNERFLYFLADLETSHIPGSFVKEKIPLKRLVLYRRSG
ncbi:MAG TPA: glycosyltransferase family 39 protein [Candidatus Ozemobacteraceae bacterium]|nr:glycosyltransferase family 39 protein [Candidatus Ozemobacteraceae bacterium]